MARREGGTAHAPHWRVSAALAIALPLAFSPYSAVLQGDGWWIAFTVTAAAILGAATVARALLPGRWGRLGSSGVAAIVAFGCVWLASGDASSSWGLPTSRTVDLMLSLGRDGVASLATQEAPAQVDPGVLFLFTLGVAVVSVLCDVLALGLRAPAATGFLLLPIAVAPAFIVQVDEPGWMVVATLAWLLVLVAARPVKGRRSWDVVAVLGAALAASLLATVILPTPSVTGQQGSGQGGSIRSGVNPVVTLGEDLRREQTVTAFEYRSSSGDGHYFRLTALDTLGDEGWTAGPTPEAASDVGAVPAPVGLGEDVAREVESTSVSIRSLGGGWVPTPYPATRVEGLSTSGTWDPRSHSLRVEGRSVRGEDYEVQSLVIAPTPQQLQDVGTVVPRDFSDLATADASWPSLIAETAAAVTAGTSTNYERALALQEYLRDGGDFEYSEFAPLQDGYDDTSAGSVAAFLEQRSGYCVQFASAMAFMARSLGIPSRMALGFLPGQSETDVPDDARVWTVTSDELHTWPELYFEGIGWVPFEPTTSRGDPPPYAEEDALDAVVDDAEVPDAAAPVPAPTAPAAPQRDERDVGGVGQAESGITIPPVVWLLLGLLALSAVPAIVRAVVRARRLARVRAGSAEVALAWREVMESARDLDLPVSEMSTPRVNAAVLGEALGEQREALGALLGALLGAVERESYAAGGAQAGRAPDDTRSLLRALRRSAGPRQRWLAALWPRTLVERIIGAIS